MVGRGWILLTAHCSLISDGTRLAGWLVVMMTARAKTNEAGVYCRGCTLGSRFGNLGR